MSYTFLNRKDYDVRFINIPPIPKKRYESYISFRLKEIYPGHSSSFPYHYRILKNKQSGTNTAIIVFIKENVIVNNKTNQNLCPIFYLPSLLKKLPEDYTGTLFLYSDGITESVTIEKGIPIISRQYRMNSQATEENSLVFLTDETNRSEFLDKIGNPQILTRPRNLKKGKLRENRSSTGKTTLIITAVFLFILLNISVLKYKSLQEENIYFLSEFIKNKQNLHLEYISLKDEVEKLETQLTGGEILDKTFNPFRIISLLYESAEGLLTVTGITLKEDEFTIEGESPDPMSLATLFSETPGITDLSVDRIIPRESTYYFKLKGSIR